ncbi:Transmembrane protein [Trichostrongylus colubriformis]|uniref:Transmembrane protein n=1 Tax=Trichostrongylus colubriformis TaxID=6319 RepID=A0AAN8EUH7_TRICO
MDRTVPEPEESKQDDVDDGATYSGASTSRLASTPVQKKASVSNSGSPENDVKANQSRRETDEQTENRAEAMESNALRRAFQGIVRRREVKSDLDRRTAPGTVISKKATQSDSVVYVEKNGKFRAMKKNVFEREKEVGVKKTRDDVFSSIISFISSKHPDVAVAYSLQRNFHNVSMIMQGFLSGLTVAEAVFAFSFANEELLLNAYRWLSLPVHVVFLICFTIGCVAAIDRTGFYGWKVPELKKTLSHGGVIGIILWSIGLIASSACIQFDEALAPVVEEVVLTPELLLYWRICSAVRAVCASAAWLLLALRPDCNVLGDIIKKTAVDEMLQRNVDLLEEVPTELKNQVAKMLNIPP